MPSNEILLWGGFVAGIVALLALDLAVFHRKAHAVGIRRVGALMRPRHEIVWLDADGSRRSCGARSWRARIPDFRSSRGGAMISGTSCR